VVTVLCQSAGEDLPAPPPGVTIRPVAERGGGTSGLKRLAAATRTAAERGEYDVIHGTLPVPGCNVYQPRGGTEAGQAAYRASRRCCAASRSLGTLLRRLHGARRLRSRWERQLVAQPAARCLAVSGMIAEEFANLLKRTGGVDTIRNGVDIPQTTPAERASQRREIRRQLGIADEALVAVSPCGGSKLKGQDETLRAWSAWSADVAPAGARLVILGGAPSPQPGGADAARVHRAGQVPDVFPYYSAADIVILLSWYDACSRAVLEAVRWHVPALTTACNGAAEVLEGGAGVVVDRPDEAGQVSAALTLLADEGARARARSACERIADSLSMSRHVDQLMEIYREVASE
jgi:UDP-glucose:(heptosyl)LPS alpha-1,3-glucosyltransferase